MRSFLDAKLMAKALRQSLAERHIDLTHSDCLEIVANQFGLADWNLLAARMAAASADEARLPAGWIRSGQSNAGVHRIALDPAEPGAMLIESIVEREAAADQFATLMQSIVAGDYRGQKVRLTAELKGEDAGLGTIWMRIDPEHGPALRFDNLTMRSTNGALEGTFDWRKRTIVLDVPGEAASIHYGFFLQGDGRLWARNFEVDVADPDAPVTGDEPFLPGPTNLGFGAAATR
jgi:hypothetical protein